MLITKTVKTKPTRTFKYYRDLGYQWERGEQIEVLVKHLPKNSCIKVEVKCEGGCEKIFLILYKDYLLSIERGYLHDYCCKKCSGKIRCNEINNPMLNQKSVDKMKNAQKKTFMEKYGTEYIMKNAKIKKKTQNTILKRYGVIGIINIPGAKEKIKATKEKNGTIMPMKLKNSWEIYQNDVRNGTRKNTKELFDNWDGFDYYDGEYIKDNMMLNSNNDKRPSIDHKISKIYGFKNGIPASEISKLDNLCITKKGLNSIKNMKNEVEFKKLL